MLVHSVEAVGACTISKPVQQSLDQLNLLTKVKFWMLEEKFKCRNVQVSTVQSPHHCLNAASSPVPLAGLHFVQFSGGSLELCLPPPWKLWDLAMRVQNTASAKLFKYVQVRYATVHFFYFANKACNCAIIKLFKWSLQVTVSLQLFKCANEVNKWS